jgi:predicted adenylyl cyclase CyaB
MASLRQKHVPRDRTLEAEIKFRLNGTADLVRLRRRLHQLGAKSDGTYHEENLRFELKGKRPTPVSLRLRIIDAAAGGILTTKGPAKFVRGLIKVREETEVEVRDAKRARDLLETLGYRVAFTYHKHRSAYRLGLVLVTLDTLDFGFFSEIEGPSDVLLSTAVELGLTPSKAVKSSYSAMAKKHFAKRGAVVPPAVHVVA